RSAGACATLGVTAGFTVEVVKGRPAVGGVVWARASVAAKFVGTVDALTGTSARACRSADERRIGAVIGPPAVARAPARRSRRRHAIRRGAASRHVRPRAPRAPAPGHAPADAP